MTTIVVIEDGSAVTIVQHEGILPILHSLSRKVDAIMATLADVQAAVAAENTVAQSVVTLLQSLSAQLQAAIAGNDPVALQGLVDSINTQAATMAAAVTANTPAAATT